MYGSSLGEVNLTYEIIITSITPASGSILGGTEITITGTNFCKSTLDNAVYLNKKDNNLWC